MMKNRSENGQVMVLLILALVGLFAFAGLTINDISDPTGAAIAVISGIVITIVCVIGIMYISKWGGITKK